MLPWGHLAVGYLVFTFFTDVRYQTPQTFGTLVAVAVGTQLPDLIDKPFAWYLHVLPNGRSFSHSIFVSVLLVGLVYVVARRYDRPLVGAAFGCGYLTHLGGDALYPLLRGEWAELVFLLWPAATFPYDDADYTILQMLVDGALTPTGVFEAGLLVLAVAVWVHLEMPGLQPLRARWERLQDA
ncbi:metal-dependent hydrolase [Natronomonas salina]|uniref:metal-dependent hydrolase n=1 Tax=Natronomonas salina TaxID=1710540 RepID=UPI0015B70220|nr:metal-dependent hydrolase [Natronomonas salina]QLD88757.1 metal-dependent hydrolase [Natronomonas salina]